MRSIVWRGLIIFGVVFSFSSEAAQWTASVKMSRKKSERISGLRFVRKVPVKGRSGFAPKVTIRGEFRKRGWGLYRNKKWLVKRKGGTRKFSFKAPLQGEKTNIVLKAVSPSNKVKKIKLTVNFPAWAALQTGDAPSVEEIAQEEEPRVEKAKPKRKRKRRRASRDRSRRRREAARNEGALGAAALGTSLKRSTFVFALGGSNLSYTETGVDDFTMLGLTGKVFFKYVLSPRKWDLAFNVFGTIFAINSNRSETDVRYLGFNGRLGYHFIDAYPVSLGLLAGVYYTTMSVSENAFGFKNMFGPSVAPVLTYQIPNGDVASLYVKYAIIAGLAFDNRELAVGANYGITLTNSHVVGFYLDYSTIAFAIDDTDITNNALSFSVGYGF